MALSVSLLLDTSVLTRLREPAVRRAVSLLDEEGLRCTTLTKLEIGFSARNAEEWDRLTRAVGVFGVIEVAESHLLAASRTQRLLADSGLRGRKIPDLIIAAVAAAEGLEVVHYDRAFEHIATVTGQAHRWVVPAGSVD